jgi:hypothetical protein
MDWLLRVTISFLYVALISTTSAAAQDAQIKGNVMNSRGGSMDRLGGEGHHGRPLLRFAADLDDLYRQFLEMTVVKRRPN